MNGDAKPLRPGELDRLVDEAMRLTQSRADLLRRNDELLIRLMRCQTETRRLLKWVKRNKFVPDHPA